VESAMEKEEFNVESCIAKASPFSFEADETYINGDVNKQERGALTTAHTTGNGFHIVDGKMFIRYRDIMNFAFGRRMSYITWILQFINLFLNNTSFILAAGIALKGINSEFSGSPLRLQYFLMMGRSLLHLHIFSSNIIGNEKLARNLGHLHLLLHYNPCHYFGHRWYSFLLIQNIDWLSGAERDYDIKGSKVDKVFHALSAIAVLVPANSSGLLSEMQSTLRKRASAAGSYLHQQQLQAIPRLNSLKLLKSMKDLLRFICYFINLCLPLHVSHRLSLYSSDNLIRRFVLRALIFMINTLLAAAFPFARDFVNLMAAIFLIPLTFVFISVIFIKVKGKTARSEQKVWHWAIIVFSPSSP
ncbi:hypothetical protein GIB67_003673, partial [Kingdonia uniflora]